MRSALGTEAPASLKKYFMNQPRMPRGSSSGRAGPLDSATSTSPFGSTYSQRG